MHGQKIRMKVGVDYIGVTCVFFCHDGNGRLLMHKRSQNCRDEHGRWDCGAGALEFGEDHLDAVKREVKEEYGADALDVTFVKAANVLREHEGKRTHWIALNHVVRVDPDQVENREPDKMDDIGWFAINDLPDPLHSMFESHFALVRHLIK